jgi:hypothetical protein
MPVAPSSSILALLYSQRWEIELATPEIKSQQAAQAPLRSKTRDGVLQEIYAHCLLHSLNRQLVYTAAATTAERDPDRVRSSVRLRIRRGGAVSSRITGLGKVSPGRCLPTRDQPWVRSWSHDALNTYPGSRQRRIPVRVV